MGYFKFIAEAFSGPNGRSSGYWTLRTLMARLRLRVLAGKRWPSSMVISPGGVATTTLLEFLDWYQDTNLATDADGIKHLPYVPWRAIKSGSRVLYLTGPCEDSEASLRRRGLLLFQILKLFRMRYFREVLQSRDAREVLIRLCRKQASEYKNASASERVMVLEYRELFTHQDKILQFFRISDPRAKDYFPNYRPRHSGSTGRGIQKSWATSRPHQVSDSARETPVLVIAQKRPKLTEVLIDRLRIAECRNIYFFCDAPGKAEDDDAVRASRRLVNRFDWDVDVTVEFAEQHLGSKVGPVTAISNFFEKYESGIVLEDDILPSLSFFDFATQTLSKFRNDSRVGLVSATNQAGPAFRARHSYVFSRNKATWGWASWRASWETYREDLAREIDGESMNNILAAIGSGSKASQTHWRIAAAKLESGEIDAWDWHFFFSLAAANMLTVFPAVNLAVNKGFGSGATHTFGSTPDYVSTAHELKFPLNHPEFMVPDQSFEGLFEANKLFHVPASQRN